MADQNLIETKITALVKVIDCVLKGLESETGEQQSDWWGAMQGESIEAVRETTADLCHEIPEKLWEKHIKPSLT